MAFPWGSRSTIRTRLSLSASAAPNEVVVVVLPTPPFWLATAKILIVVAFRHEPLPDLGDPDTASNSCHSTRFLAFRQVPMFHVKHSTCWSHLIVSRETFLNSETRTSQVFRDKHSRIREADVKLFHVKHQNRGLFRGVPMDLGDTHSGSSVSSPAPDRRRRDGFGPGRPNPDRPSFATFHRVASESSGGSETIRTPPISQKLRPALRSNRRRTKGSSRDQVKRFDQFGNSWRFPRLCQLSRFRCPALRPIRGPLRGIWLVSPWNQ